MAKRPRITRGMVFQPAYRDKKTGQRKTSSIWWLKYYVKGRSTPIRESSHTEDRREAVVILKRKLAEAAARPETILSSDRVTVNQLLDLVLADYKLHRRKSYGDVKSKIEKHLRPEFGGRRAEELTSAHLRSYMLRRQTEGAQHSSINRELAPLRKGLRLGWQQSPPLVRVPLYFPQLSEKGNIRTGILKPEEFGGLRKACSIWPHLELALVIAFRTGIRKGELLAMKWEHVDLENKRIMLPAVDTKNERHRILPIYAEMMPCLAAARIVHEQHFPGCPFVIQLDGLPLRSFRRSWARACKLAGRPDLRFHDLRRSALTAMEEAGVPRKIARGISGHQTESVYLRYVIVQESAIKLAAEQLEAHYQAALVRDGQSQRARSSRDENLQ